MKKNIVLLMLFSVNLLLFISCGSSSKNEITIKGADGKEYESYREACRAGDFDVAHKFVDKMKEASEDRYKIEEAEDYIFNNEVNFLVAQNTKEANARIIFLLNEKPIKGTAYPEGACIEKDVYLKFHPYGEHNNFGSYIKWGSKFNSNCMNVLNLSISLKNKQLAEYIVSMFREDAQVIYKNEYTDNGTVYGDIYAHYTNESKEQAKKLYDEALKSGAFD